MDGMLLAAVLVGQPALAELTELELLLCRVQ
jgi:hypothetical protein